MPREPGFPEGQRGLLPLPPPARGRSGIMVRRDLVRGAEMYFRIAPKGLRTLFLHNLARGLLNRRGDAATERDPGPLPLALQPVDERFPRQDRCRRDCEVRFRLRLLLEPNALAVLQKRF